MAFQQENCYSLNETLALGPAKLQGGFLGTGEAPQFPTAFIPTLFLQRGWNKALGGRTEGGGATCSTRVRCRANGIWASPTATTTAAIPCPFPQIRRLVRPGGTGGYRNAPRLLRPRRHRRPGLALPDRKRRTAGLVRLQIQHLPRRFPGLLLTLEADLDLTGARYGGSAEYPLNWVPIGWDYRSGTGFAGLLEGKGHTISRLCASSQRLAGSTADVGLFGHIAGGTVQNLLLKDPHNLVNSASTGSWVGLGGLVSRLTMGAKLINCGIQGGLIEILPSDRSWSENFVGGLVGDVHSGGATLQNCFSTAEVSDRASSKKHTTGGLVGAVSGPLHREKLLRRRQGQRWGRFHRPNGFRHPYRAHLCRHPGRRRGRGQRRHGLTTVQMQSLAALEGLNKT